MSDYRDDTLETAVARDVAWGGFRGRVSEDYARIAASLFVAIGVLHADQAAASDETFGRHVGFTVEQAAGSDLATGVMHVAAPPIFEVAQARDRVIDRTRATLEEHATIRDDITVRATDVIREQAMLADATFGTLHARVSVFEVGRIRDILVRHVAEVVADSALASDAFITRMRARGLTVESAALLDEAPSAHAALVHVTESVRLTDETTGLLHAASLIEEGATADATIVSHEVTGQAWVSEAENWAMSRYEPFGFEAAAVVDGVVFVSGPGGFFALDGDTEAIEAHLRTGKVDVSGGNLAKPVAMYVEYELDGAVAVTVGQTQSGALQQWTYPLPDRPAAELTNARTQFGRGLRGRHFTFELRLTGASGYINDATLLVEKTGRRI